MTEKRGRFARLFQHIANHVPMGILDSLHMDRRHPITIPNTFTNITTAAGIEFPQDFCQSYCKFWIDVDGKYCCLHLFIHKPLPSDCPKEVFKKWFGEIDPDQKSFIIEWLLKLEEENT